MSDAPREEPTEVALVLTEPLQRLAERFHAAGLKAEAVEGYEDDDVLLRVEYPEGRDTRVVAYDEGDAEQLDGVDLRAVRFLPDRLALVDVSTGDVEAQVRTRTTWNLRRIPGFEELEVEDDPEEEALDDAPILRMAANWRLAVEEEGVRLELSPASGWYRAVRGISSRSAPTTLKVSGLSHTSSEDTAHSLQTLSDSFFFDLDVRYGAVIDLVPSRGRVAPVRLRAGSTPRPAEFPQNRYLAQPAALYRYGRSAQGLPLLSFLAFYQVLEYFFPIFTGSSDFRWGRAARRWRRDVGVRWVEALRISGDQAHRPEGPRRCPSLRRVPARAATTTPATALAATFSSDSMACT